MRTRRTSTSWQNPFLLLIQQQGAFPRTGNAGEYRPAWGMVNTFCSVITETERKSRVCKKVTVATGTAKIILEDGGDYSLLRAREIRRALPAEEEITAVAGSSSNHLTGYRSAVALESTRSRHC